jgi:hypothetical protein
MKTLIKETLVPVYSGLTLSRLLDDINYPDKVDPENVEISISGRCLLIKFYN